jgi:hypothetical protein
MDLFSTIEHDNSHSHHDHHTHNCKQPPTPITVAPTTTPFYTTTNMPITTTHTPKTTPYRYNETSCSLPDNNYINKNYRENSYVSIKDNNSEFSLFPKKRTELENIYLDKNVKFDKNDFPFTTQSGIGNSKISEIKETIRRYFRSSRNITKSSTLNQTQEEQMLDIKLDKFFDNINIEIIKDLIIVDFKNMVGMDEILQNKINIFLEKKMNDIMERQFIKQVVDGDITKELKASVNNEKNKLKNINRPIDITKIKYEQLIKILNTRVKKELVLRLIRNVDDLGNLRNIDLGNLGYLDNLDNLDTLDNLDNNLEYNEEISGKYDLLSNKSITEVQNTIKNEVKKISNGKYRIGNQSKEKINNMLRFYYLENTINGYNWQPGNPQDCREFNTECYDESLMENDPYFERRKREEFDKNKVLNKNRNILRNFKKLKENTMLELTGTLNMLEEVPQENSLDGFQDYRFRGNSLRNFNGINPTLSPKIIAELQENNEIIEGTFYDKLGNKVKGVFNEQPITNKKIQKMTVDYFVSSILSYIPNYLRYLDDIQNSNKTICSPKYTNINGENNHYRIPDGLL